RRLPVRRDAGAATCRRGCARERASRRRRHLPPRTRVLPRPDPAGRRRRRQRPLARARRPRTPRARRDRAGTRRGYPRGVSAHADDPEALPDGRVLLRPPGPAHRHQRVRLLAGLGTLDPRPDLSWSDGVWSVCAALPPVDRVEYAFEVTTAGQPAPAVVPGGVLERHGYAPPAWCGREVPDGAVAPLPLDVAGVTARLWSPAGLDGPAAAPLLVVHDGPDYLEHAALGRYLSVLAADGEAPPTRVLALTADPRDRLYGACDEYAQALVAAVLPRANEHAPTTAVVGLGASLGALAVLHAEWRHPGTFGAMLLQSGAFFTP